MTVHKQIETGVERGRPDSPVVSRVAVDSFRSPVVNRMENRLGDEALSVVPYNNGYEARTFSLTSHHEHLSETHGGYA